MITLRNHAPRSYMTWLPVTLTWLLVTLTWLLHNLQLWRHKRWFRKFTVRFRPIRKEIASSMYNNTIIMSRTLKVTGNHVMYDRGAWFILVIRSSSRALCCLLSVKEQKHDFIFFCSMYKTIIRFGFCDIQNNRGIGKGYQPQPSASASADNLDLDYSGCHKNFIQ